MRQQQPFTSPTQALHPQLQSDAINFILSDPVNQTQPEKSLHDRIPVSKAVCKSESCEAEIVEGYDGHCLTCYVRYHPPTHDQVRQIDCMINTKLISYITIMTMLLCDYASNLTVVDIESKMKLFITGDCCIRIFQKYYACGSTNIIARSLINQINICIVLCMASTG